MKAWRAIDAVGIEQSHGWHLEMGADSRHILGQGRAFEEAECTTRVKLNVQVLKTRAQLSVVSSQKLSQNVRTAFSVIRPFHEPDSVQQVVHQAVESDLLGILQGDV